METENSGKEKEKNKNSENQEKVRRLQNYLDQGYLLHGSKMRVDVLEPRQASDDRVERVAGKARAVYAEAHDLRVPIAMALYSKKDSSLQGWNSKYHGSGPGKPLMIGGENCALTSGYVYVLPHECFEIEGDERDREFVCTEPVQPVDIIDVDPSILGYLEGITTDFKD